MKKTLRILSCLFTLSFGLSAASCMNRIGGKEGVLSIASFKGGYGDTWALALGKAYKKYNPNADVQVACTALVRDDAVTAAQTNISSVDLYFIDGLSVGQYCENYGSLADLSELYSSSPKAGTVEENTTVGEKIRPEILSEMMYGGDQSEFVNKYYTVPSPSGPCSLILNIDALNNVLGKGNWAEPKTSDELFALCDAINSAKAKVTVAGVKYTVYPFIYGGDAVEYWRYIYHTWIAQYDGAENWENFLNCKENGKYTASAYQTEGKEKSYAQFEKLIKRSNGYCDPSSMNNKVKASQKYFLQGRACMYMTGDWLEREMENTTEYSAELKMIRTPVTSDYSEKLESKYEFSLGATEQEKDRKLAEIIAAVDSGKTSLSGVNEKVFDAVKKTRAITYTLGNSAIGFVPECSVNKELAIDFLRFMYSDEGIQIVLNESRSYLPVINTDHYQIKEEDLSTFRKSVNDISKSTLTYIYTSSKDPIHYRAGMDCYMGNEKPEVALGKKTGAMTASEYLSREMVLLNEKWNDFMYNVK